MVPHTRAYGAASNATGESRAIVAPLFGHSLFVILGHRSPGPMTQDDPVAPADSGFLFTEAGRLVCTVGQ